MRNLRIASHAQYRLDLGQSSKSPSSTHIHALAIDSSSPQSQDIAFCATASDSLTSTAVVDIDVWKVHPRQRHISSFAAPFFIASLDRQIVSLDYLADGGSFVQDEPALCLISAGGDIALIALYGEDEDRRQEPSLPEIVGSVEQGILAASWSPDQELLVLITAPSGRGSTVLLMTREFEVLSESPLHTDDFGEERPIALGWGSKATQFHGSEGKEAAAAAREAATSTASRGPVLPSDDGCVRISWRGDSSIFVVSSAEIFGNEKSRVIRTFGKSGTLLATSDLSLQGISHALAYRPSGIVMATTQMLRDNEHTVTFLERNGLQKGSFALRRSSSFVRELAWNNDGSLLAVWFSTNEVQIWSTGNYHWYLKQEIVLESSVTSVRWHVDSPSEFYLSTPACVHMYSFVLDACISSSQCMPNEAACAAVVDGSQILLTPFRIQNVPPPMSSVQITIPNDQTPVDLAWATASREEESASLLNVLTADGTVHVWALHWGNLSDKKAKSEAWKQPWHLCTIRFGLKARQLTASAHRQGDFVKIAVGVLAIEGFESLKLATQKVHWTTHVLGNVRFESLSLGRPQRRMLVAALPLPKSDAVVARSVFVQEDKVLRNMSGDRITLAAGSFRQLAFLNLAKAVGLTDGGQLFLNTTLLARDANSFVLTDSHIIWTNVAHEAHFLPIEEALLGNTDGGGQESAIALSRRVERGSRIVCAIPSNMTLILQMPRGNLETISPRPLVLDVVRRSLQARQYGKAFRICRTHRLDMNIIVDHDEQRFLDDVPLFVRQVHDGEHLNLFLSSLSAEKLAYRPNALQSRIVGRSPFQPSAPTEDVLKKQARINAICDAVRDVLRRRNDVMSFVNTILTTHVRKSPPDFEAALKMLGELKAQDASMADEACKYTIFLTDADKLFNAALGTYDFTLPLLVAHHSPRKDPREYLPFLRELRAIQPMEMQRFKIDETLQRWEKALEWLVKAGEFTQALAFIEQHELYLFAFPLYADKPARLAEVQEAYGEWLVEHHRYKEAGVLFAQCGQRRKAVDADVKAGFWREAFAQATLGDEFSAEEVKKLAQRVSASLSAYGRNTEAATVSLEYLNDVDGAIRLLCKDLEFGEAKRIAAKVGRSAELVQSSIGPMVLESADVFLEEIAEVHEQGAKQFARLEELRIRKRERPEDFYPDVDVGGGAGVDGAENVDGASQAFTTFTRFTRYTAFTNNASLRRRPSDTMSQFTMRTKAASQTAKSRKKEMRKQGTGKKNSIYEEDYLYTSLIKLVGQRLEKMQKDAGKVIQQLTRLGEAEQDEYRARARALTESLDAFERQMGEMAMRCYEENVDDEDALEKERIRAIEEGTSLGLSWTQLQANGLFAPPMRREPIVVSTVEWRQPALEG